MWCCGSSKISLEKDDYMVVGSNSSIALVHNKTVNIYGKENLNERLVLNFESQVNTASFTDKDGRFLLVAEHSGLLHTIHCITQRLISTDTISNSYNDVGKTFLSICSSQIQSSVYILLSDSTVHFFDGVNYAALDEALKEGSMQKAFAIKQQVKKGAFKAAEGTQVVIPYADDASILTLGDEENSICRYDCLDGCWTLSAESSLHGYGTFTTGVLLTNQFLLTATDRGCLILWSLVTFTAVRLYEDLSVLQMASLNDVQANLCESEIVIAGHPKKDSPCSLLLLKLPSLTVTYMQPCHDLIIANGYTDQSCAHFIGSCDGAFGLTSIVLHSPEARLNLMIAQQQFAQAFIFAEQNSLDKKLVYKAKAEWIVTHDLDLTLAADLRLCLENMSDVDTIVDICLSSKSSNPDIFKATLKFALNRLKQHNCVGSRFVLVLRKLQLFKSFTLAFGLVSFNSESWQSFLNCDLQAEILKRARSEAITSAMILWSQHKGELRYKVTHDWLNSLLSCFGTSLDDSAVYDWLRFHIIPLVNDHFTADYLEVFGQNTERLVRDYELSNKDAWPENSLRLCSLLDEIRSPVLTPSLARIGLLRQNLQTIKELKLEYECPLSYSVFCQQTKDSLVYRLLDVVQVPSMFKHQYEKIALRYMQQNGIEPDKALQAYVLDIISNFQYIRGYDPVGLLWEQKAVAVVNCIQSPVYRVKAVMHLAKHCQIPWNKCISETVEEACQYNLDCAEELKDVVKKSRLSHILSLYNIPRELIPTAANALLLIKYILKESKYGHQGVVHCLQVAEALNVPNVTVFMTACQGLISQGEEISHILSLIPADMKPLIVTRLINYACCLLEESFDWAIKSAWSECAISLLNLYSEMIDSSWLPFPSQELLKRMQNVQLLKKEFAVDVKLSMISASDMFANISLLLKQLIKSSDKGSLNVFALGLVINHLLRFSHLACLRPADFYHVVFTELKQLFPMEIGDVIMIFLMNDSSTEFISYIITYTSELITKGELDVKAAYSFVRVLRRCLTFCSDENLLISTRLCAMVIFSHDIMSSCLGGDGDRVKHLTQDMTSDVSELEALYCRKMYSEKDLIINTKSTSEATQKFLKMIFQQNFDQTSIDLGSYTLLLGSHDLLCLRMMLHLYYSSIICDLGKSDAIENLRCSICSHMKTSISELVHKLLSQRNLDIYMTLAALSDMPFKDGLSIVKRNASSNGSQYVRILALSNIALVMCSANKQLSYMDMCKNVKRDAVWGFILNLYDVSFLSAYGKDCKNQLLPQIVTKCPQNLIDTYISDFSLNHDQTSAFISRIKHLCDKHNQLKFWCKSDQGMKILEEITELFNRIPDKTELVNIIKLCSPYNYQLIKTLLHVEKDVNAKKLLLLDILELYQRNELPSTWEKEEFLKDIFQGATDIYKTNTTYISEKRLPYHALVYGNVWKVLLPELSVKTFESLLPMASLLEIDADVYLLNTALQIANCHINTNMASRTGTVWCTDDSVNSVFFNSIFTVLAAIQEKKSAVMCCQTLITKLPDGVEKILALKLCIDLTKAWKESLSEGTEDWKVTDITIKKLRAMCGRLSLEKCLHQYNLFDEKYLQIIDEPVVLVQEIIESTHNDSHETAMNKIQACRELCELAGRDMKSICFTIVTSWLSTANQQQANADMDMTVTMDMVNVGAQNLTKEDVSRQEVKKKEKWIINLANSDIGDKIVVLLNSFLNSLSSSTSTKLLVVSCFLALGETSYDAPANSRSPSAFVQLSVDQLCRQYKALHYIEKLEKLNITMNVDEFYSCDALALISSLKKNFSTSSTAVELIADLCIENQIYEIPLWRFLLHQLVQLNLMDKLVQVLACCSHLTQLWNVDSFQQAWIKVVDFSSYDPNCQRLVSSCPISDCLNRL